MSYTSFIPKAFSAKHERLIDIADAVMTQYSRQGYDLSLRQLYYQFVAHHGLPNTEQNYKMLGGVISDARLAGQLDWEVLVDRGRETVTNPHWDDPASFLESCAQQYRFDLWRDQPYHVEVMVEKQALEGVLVPVCQYLDVPFSANKGYSSSSHLYQVGGRIKSMLDAGKQVVVLYLGDHDPSGIDMSRDVEDRLKLFSGYGDWSDDEKKVVESGRYDEDQFTLVRVALNMSQVRQYNPPPNPAKMTDSRAEGYVARYGRQSWELDALDPAVLARLVTDHVAEYTDDARMADARAQMSEERQALIDMAEQYRRDR